MPRRETSGTRWVDSGLGWLDRLWKILLFAAFIFTPLMFVVKANIKDAIKELASSKSVQEQFNGIYRQRTLTEAEWARQVSDLREKVARLEAWKEEHQRQEKR